MNAPSVAQGAATVTVHEYLVPRSLPEAIGLLERHGPDLLVMAGGTVAMPLINEGISLPERVMGLRRAGLDGIERAATTLADRRRDDAHAAARAGRRPAAPRGGAAHRQLVHPQHGHGGRQPVHAAPGRRRRGGPARARRPRPAGRPARRARRSRWPTSSPAS